MNQTFPPNTQIVEQIDTEVINERVLSQSLIPQLKKTKGSIVNIASISGLRGSTLRVAYGTSKAAVIQLTKQQACELGEYGIRVNTVAPGPVKTKLSMAVHSPQIIKAYHDAIPLNRYGSEREIGEVIFFLSSIQLSIALIANLPKGSKRVLDPLPTTLKN